MTDFIKLMLKLVVGVDAHQRIGFFDHGLGLLAVRKTFFFCGIQLKFRTQHPAGLGV